MMSVFYPLSITHVFYTSFLGLSYYCIVLYSFNFYSWRIKMLKKKLIEQSRDQARTSFINR